MKDTPELVGISVCERVLQDIFRRDTVTLVNVHNSINSKAFPTLVPILYVFAQLRGSQRAFNYQFKILDPRGELLASSGASQVEPLPTSSYLHKIISAFPGLIFPADGNYSIVLEIDDKQIGSIPFLVELIPLLAPTAV